jgi:hypothetical protein
MLTEKQFEGELRRRNFEPPSVGFADRIIASAGNRFPYFAVWDVSGDLKAIACSLLPKKAPAFAFACIILMGVFIGVGLPVQTGQEQVAFAGDEEIL